MKNRTFATLGLLALLATASAFGQERMRFEIPFEFSTGTTAMPAGEYTVTQSEQSGLTNLACYTCKVNVRFITHQVGSYSTRDGSSKLVFHKYGDKYFLSSVWKSGSGIGHALPTSNAEREVSLSASLAPPSQVVLFALR